MPVRKHTPIRTCVACRTAAPKQGFMRVVRTPTSTVEVDPTGKRAGRGAYVCRNVSCVQTAIKTKRLERTLKASVPAEVAQELLRLAAQSDEEVTRL